MKKKIAVFANGFSIDSLLNALKGIRQFAAEKDFDMILEKYGKRAHVVMFRKDIPDSPRVNPKIGTFYDTNKNPLVVGTTFEEFVNTCNSINICWAWFDWAELLADD